MADFKAKTLDMQAASMVCANKDEGGTVKAPYFMVGAECYGPDGVLKWKDQYTNVVVAQGRAMLINKFFGNAAAAQSEFFLALHSQTTASGHDVGSISGAFIGSHSANWPRLTWNSTLATQVSTTQSGSFSFTAGTNVTISGGAILVYTATSMATNSTANASLYSEGHFAAARTIQASDVLNVTATLSFA